MRFLLASLILLFCTTQQAAASCREAVFSENAYVICEFDTGQDKISLFNLDDKKQPFGNLARLQETLSAQGQTLTFAMNAGMYGEDLKPIGLYIENGKQARKLNRRSAAGNFYLKPNGVFYIANGKPGIKDTEAYAKSGLKPELATQSGPMLVINGEIHPKISPAGTSRKIRNGVGIGPDGKVIFVISNSFVTFHEFASVFRDELKCQNALFLDGSVSSLYSTELNRFDFRKALGPMVGVTKPLE